MSDPNVPQYPGQGQAAAGQGPYEAPGQQGQFQQQGQYAQPGQYPNWEQQQPAKATGLTIAALVIGIVALVLSFIPIFGMISFVLGPLAVVLGIVGLVKKRPKKGFSITGIITGVLALIMAIVWAVVSFFAASVLTTGGDSASYTFEATSEGSASYGYIGTSIEDVHDGLLAPGETFSEQVEASTILGSVFVMNAPGETGSVGCVIRDADGAVVSESTVEGEGAEATCSVLGG
ncbi:DUF4190 domain-containing protein [Zafaria sp. Z1313]|uniref:DUF4190 domain-containing protein n=1 Tax=unclassified Zafaria TaxID=2828765 RepID=UPI002E79E524|nr:DUF4190 domain-containing protein [Zafaria sp. J156]MEE1622278.1 DUF4190 domain-containing protein [Zafaria sp. J156]